MSATLTFVSPLLGLRSLTEFELAELDGVDGLFTMRATEDRDVRLFLIDAATHVPKYQPVIARESCRALELPDGEDPALLVVVTHGPDGLAANLLAPIVVNPHTGSAAQLILDGQDYPVRASLPFGG